MQTRTRRIVRWTAILATAGAVAALGVAQAGGGHGPGSYGFGGPGFGMMGMGPMRGLVADLDLTDDQRHQLRTIVRNGWEQSAAQRARLDELRRQIESTVRTNGFNEAEVRALVDSGTPVMADLMVDMVRGMSEMRAVLTPEQQQRFDAWRAEREAKRAERRARRAGRSNAAATTPADAT
jgi:Spy/CpxP family protein refolding chaperone